MLFRSVYGLCLIDPEKYFPKVASMIEHLLPGHRAAGAWLLGRIGDPRRLPMLKPLLLEKNALVRGAAFRALQTLRGVTRVQTDAVCVLAASEASSSARLLSSCDA